MAEHRIGAPVFVKVDDYKEILDVLDMIKGKISDIRGTLAGINEMRSQEDAEISAWNDAIGDIEKKIDNFDKMIFEPE